MENFQYTLEKYKGRTTKHRCPECNENHKFTRYINTETGDHLHSTVGRCDRVDKCGYHYKPKQYFSDNKHLSVTPTPINYRKPKPLVLQKEIQPSFIPFEIFQSSLGKGLEKNNFITFLTHLLGKDSVRVLIERYYISSSKLWNGATVFWQIDKSNNIRSGKIMLYDLHTGKRDKTKNSWVHSALKLSPFNLKQCFFGEHLLIDKSKTVAIVESDKTAIIMSSFLPEYIWLSSSGKEGLNYDKFKALQGRTVILFPDLSKSDAKVNCYEFWSKKAIEFKNIARITVSSYLEKIATDAERIEGLDLADYFIKHKLHDSSVNVIPKSLFNDLENLPKQVETKKQDSYTNTAYVDETGIVYIETPNADTYSIYPSVDHYNKRLCLPEFQKRDMIDVGKCKAVKVNLGLLTPN